MDKLKVMRSFVEVAHHKSFGEAARRLAMSTSIVSKHVADLEAELGVRLFARSTRHLEITEIGQRYLETCATVLGEIQSAEESIRDMQRAVRGEITVRAPHSLVVLHLSELVAQFSAKHPGVLTKLVVDEDPAHAVSQARRGLDVAFHMGPFSSDQLACRSIARIEWQVYGSREYLLRSGAPKVPEDLARHNCLVHMIAARDGCWSFDGVQGELKVPVRGSIESNSFLALREAARQGLGLVMLPSFLIDDDPTRGGLVRVLADHPSPGRELHLLMAPDRRRPKRIRSFVDFALKWFEARRWG